MRSSLASRTLVRPRSLDAALDAMQGDRLTPIAGATDVYVGLNFGTLADRAFIDLWPLDELRRIGLHGEGLSIGALATYREIIASPLIGERLPILAAAAREIGGIQIQNRGTLGGNIANASPAGDTLPVLAVAGAQIVLRCATGERRVPFLEFFTGYRATVRRADELLVAVEIPPLDGRQWFRKVGTRAAQAISKVVIAARRPADPGEPPQIALGSVAPTVVRLPRTEAALAGGATIDEAAERLTTEIAPIDDVRSTADYRRRTAANLLRQWWRETS